MAQTWSDLELLIWDDGSTDRSVEIASEYAQQDQRIRVIAAKHTGIALLSTGLLQQPLEIISVG
ncbi:glycosyltransferase [Nostoc sp. KVJ3]|uniref:glycosyltransferase n=1 Tax=Nostoc sp. KVJ3 TaxID=457945 RepID=UPI0022375CD2|nr:glycosyltransferase [Nostoc sp. KVJ3]